MRRPHFYYILGFSFTIIFIAEIHANTAVTIRSKFKLDAKRCFWIENGSSILGLRDEWETNPESECATIYDPQNGKRLHGTYDLIVSKGFLSTSRKTSIYENWALDEDVFCSSSGNVVVSRYGTSGFAVLKPFGNWRINDYTERRTGDDKRTIYAELMVYSQEYSVLSGLYPISAISPDGSMGISSGGEILLLKTDAKTDGAYRAERGQLEIIDSIEGEDEFFHNVAWSPNGKMIALSFVDSIRIYSIPEKRFILAKKINSSGDEVPIGITFSNDNRLLACSLNHKIIVLDLSKNQVLSEIPIKRFLIKLDFSRDNRLVVGSTSPQYGYSDVLVYLIDSGDLLASMALKGQVNEIAFSRSSSLLLINNTVNTISTSSGLSDDYFK